MQHKVHHRAARRSRVVLSELPALRPVRSQGGVLHPAFLRGGGPPPARVAGFTEFRRRDIFRPPPQGAVRTGKPSGMRIGSKGIIHGLCRLPAGVAVIGGECSGYGGGVKAAPGGIRGHPAGALG
jgi:hypothetical protein